MENYQEKTVEGKENDKYEALVRELVPWVAEGIKTEEIFQERARTAASRLGPGSLETLVQYRLYYFPEADANERHPEFEPFGAWTFACQSAVFEIMYQLGDVCLPVIWTLLAQKDESAENVVNTLCKFALDGVDRNRIASRLAQELRRWPNRFVLSCVSPLARTALIAPRLMKAYDRRIRKDIRAKSGGMTVIDIIHEMVSYMPERKIALKMIQALVHYSPESGRQYEDLLREVMRKTGVDSTTQVQKCIEAAHRDWQAQDQGDYTVGDVPSTVGNWEDEGGTAMLPRPSRHLDDLHQDAIQAAIVLTEIFPDDPESQGNLRSWYHHHPSLRVQAILRQYA